MSDGESSNGRTADFESANLGSNPSSPVSSTAAYHRQWYQDNREHRRAQINARRQRKRNEAREFLLEYLRTRSCVDCGEDDLLVLEFDHLRDKKHNISFMVCNGYLVETIQDEIAKCEVVCANCHKRRTTKRGNFYRYVG